MTESLVTLFRRTDTFFGVCQALGDDFGLDPNWLRVGLALPLLFNPAMSFAAYGVLALAVMASRLLVPATKRSAATAAPVAISTDRNGVANDAHELARAA